MTAAQQYMKDQTGHTCDIEFASVGPTMEFIKMMCKWFAVMDGSNTRQHIHKIDPNSRYFIDIEDARLEWLEVTFLE